MKNLIKRLLRETLDEERKSKGVTLKEENLGAILTYLFETYGFDKTYVSFRDGLYVGKINPNNRFNTPTGLYGYKLSNYINQPMNDGKRFKDLFPYGSDRKYAQFLVLKDDVNLLTSKTELSILDNYVNKISKQYSEYSPIVSLCENWLNRSYSSYYSEAKHDTHKFWLLLYDIVSYLGGKKINKFTSLCRSLGINGFEDDECQGWIHPNEKCQSVFFGGNIFKDVRELQNDKDLKLPSETKYKMGIDDVKRIFEKYGYSYKTLGKILNVNDNIYDILSFAFNSDNILNFIRDNSFNPLIYYIDDRDKIQLVLKWLLENQDYISRIDNTVLRIFIHDYQEPEVLRNTILNNDNLIKSIDFDLLSYFIDNYGNFFMKRLLDNKTFLEVLLTYHSYVRLLFSDMDDPNMVYNKLGPKIVNDFLNSSNENMLMGLLKGAYDKQPILLNLFKDKYLEMINDENTSSTVVNQLKYLFNEYNILNETYKKTNVTQLIRESILLLERDFNGLSGNQLSTNEVETLYKLFQQSYIKSVGSAWDFNKFKNKISTWLLFGNSEGFITARKQNSGLLKLTGSAGNPKGILYGLNELITTNKPIWGVVTPDIASMLQKRGFIIPNKHFVKIMFNIIPANVFGDNVQINSNGGLTVNGDDGNSLNKVFVANKLYYKNLLVNNSIIDKMPTIIKLWIKAL